MLLGTLGASLLGNLLARKGIVRASSGNKKGKGIVRAGYWKEWDFFFKKIKDGAYVINFNEYADVGTHWIALFCNKNEIVYFDSFGVEHVPGEIKEFVGNKNIIGNIFRVQANNSVMCGYLCTGFIDFMLVGKKLTDFTNSFSHDFDKNDKITLCYFNNG